MNKCRNCIGFQIDKYHKQQMFECRKFGTLFHMDSDACKSFISKFDKEKVAEFFRIKMNINEIKLPPPLYDQIQFQGHEGGINPAQQFTDSTGCRDYHLGAITLRQKKKTDLTGVKGGEMKS